jgi:hypothetical protein
MQDVHMQGARPGLAPAPSQTHGKGRTCAAPGCTTRLSTYNSADRCWQHTEVVFKVYRAKRRKRNEL